MDASYKIQRGIHVHLIQFFMCPEFWVHIIFGFFGNRSLPLTPKVKIIPLCYRIVTPFFRKE